MPNIYGQERPSKKKKKASKKPSPGMLGTGMAAGAAKAIKQRYETYKAGIWK
jgi:hypothetical protein